MSIIPEKNGVPLIAWGEYMHRLPTDEEQERWAIEYPDAGAGLVCGAVSGIIGLDIDSDEEEAFIMRFIPNAETLRAKHGSKGRTIFFKYNGEASRSWKKDGKVVCELLSDKRKTTIPPSIHRTTKKPYEWINETAELTELPASLLAGLDALYPAPKREIVQYTVSNEYDKTSLNEAEEMLGYISPDCSRDEWLSIGMGLRDEYGDIAYSVWDKWSQGGSKYKPREMQNIWRSFNNSGYTIATVVYLAQQAGYIKRYENLKPVATEVVDLSTVTRQALTERKQFQAHGLVGEIADWITATAYRPQPQLALGAAISFVGLLKGHKFCTVTGLRTNTLIMNIAPTASGKEHPQKCIDDLMEACSMSEHALSEPTAGVSLLKGLLDAKRVGLWSIDELGRYLGNLNNKNSGGYQREIIDYVIKSFSKANGKLMGKKYANEKINPRVDIVEPHLCVIGASVKEKIVENCTSSEAIDGFLNRWILFESEDRPKRNKKIKFVKEVPQSIIDGVMKVMALDPNHGYALDVKQRPAVQVVRYTPEAYILINEYIELVDELTDTAPHPLNALYGRSAEHVSKLALIFSDNEFVRVPDVELAIEIVSESNKLIAAFAGLISNNQFEADYIKVREIIRTHGKLAHRDFVRKTQFVVGGQKRRNEIIADLVQAHEITVSESDAPRVYTAI